MENLQLFVQSQDPIVTISYLLPEPSPLKDQPNINKDQQLLKWREILLADAYT